MENILLGLAQSEDPAVWFVCLLGVGVVFIGLIGIVFIVSLVNVICAGLDKMKKPAKTAAAPADAAASAPIENRQEIIAAVCAAVAEENGTDISAIRVVSFKKL